MGKSARYVRCGGGWKPAQGSDSEALPTETRATDRPNLRSKGASPRTLLVPDRDPPGPPLSAPFVAHRTNVITRRGAVRRNWTASHFQADSGLDLPLVRT
jgi:hypothetical protein